MLSIWLGGWQPHFAANSVFAVGVDSLKSKMFEIASDERPTWTSGVASDAKLRLFRARLRKQRQIKVEGRKIRPY